MHDLLEGENSGEAHSHEDHALGDAGYTDVEKRDEMQGKSVRWHVAVKGGQHQGDA